MSPTLGNGKLCYLEIPATDIPRSAGFYQAVFGSNLRQRNDGHLAFDARSLTSHRGNSPRALP